MVADTHKEIADHAEEILDRWSKLVPDSRHKPILRSEFMTCIASWLGGETIY